MSARAIIEAEIEKVDRAAILLHRDGSIIALRRDSHHGELRSEIVRRGITLGTEGGTPGFVSNTGRFLSRPEAYALARKSKQVTAKQDDDLEAIEFSRMRQDVKDYTRGKA